MRKTVSLGTIFLVLAGAVTARAATIAVTNRKDVVADDGRCSLREAVTAANTGLPSGLNFGECIGGDPAPIVDVILLRRGSYKLTLGAPGDDLNAGGDLDITDSVLIQGVGRGRTKIRNRIGDPTIRGDGDRLFHVDPGAVGGVDAFFADLTLAGGDVGCTGERCSAGASAVETTGSGALTFERCRVMKNRSFCSGPRCGDADAGAAIRAFGGGALTIRRAKILKNNASCEGAGCRSGRAAIYMYADEGPTEDFVLEDSSIAGNSSLCDGEDCLTGGIVSVSAHDASVRETDLKNNQVACGGSSCSGNNVAEIFANSTTTLEDVAARNNSLVCEGEDCLVRSLLDLSGTVGVLLQNVVGVGNRSNCTGASCDTLEHVGIYASPGDIAIDGFELDEGGSTCRGDECRLDEVLDAFAAGTLTLGESRIVGQEIRCEGTRCTGDDVVRLRADTVQIEHSEVTGNLLTCSGETCRVLSVFDVDAQGDVLVSDTGVLQNVSSCIGTACQLFDVVNVKSSFGLVDITGSATSESSVLCEGDSCDLGSILDVEAKLRTLIADTTIQSNEARCVGDDCKLEELVTVEGGLAFEGSGVLENTASCEGARCVGRPVMGIAFGDAATIDASAFLGNSSQCDGNLCTVGFGGALYSRATILVVTGSTFADNSTDGFGAAIFNSPRSDLELQGVTMLRNKAGLRGTIEFGGFGGAIYNDSDGTNRGSLSLRNTEIRDNQAAVGGGILNEGRIASIQTSTLAGNQPTNCVNLGGGTGCP